nr:NAD(P)-dependent oxidoreductase [Dysosmobacter welbionis]
MPLLDSNRHIINRESIAKMRDGVVIVNCSRGELADIEALIEGIETGKIGALGMDTGRGTRASSTPTTGSTFAPIGTGSISTSSAMSS